MYGLYFKYRYVILNIDNVITSQQTIKGTEREREKEIGEVEKRDEWLYYNEIDSYNNALKFSHDLLKLIEFASILG